MKHTLCDFFLSVLSKSWAQRAAPQSVGLISYLQLTLFALGLTQGPPKSLQLPGAVLRPAGRQLLSLSPAWCHSKGNPSAFPGVC